MKTKKKQLFRRRRSCYPNDVNSNTTILSYIRTVRRLIDSLIYRKIEIGTWREKTNRYCKRTNTFCSQESYRDIYVSPFVCVSGSEWIIVFQTLSRCSHSPLSLGLKIKLGNEKILATEDEKLISRDDETGRKKGRKGIVRSTSINFSSLLGVEPHRDKINVGTAADTRLWNNRTQRVEKSGRWDDTTKSTCYSFEQTA